MSRCGPARALDNRLHAAPGHGAFRGIHTTAPFRGLMKKWGDSRRRASTVRPSASILVACLVGMLYAPGACSHVRAEAEPDAVSSEGYELTLDSRSVTQPVGQEFASAVTARFVQIEVTEVTNPRKVPLTRSLYHHSMDGNRSFLGIVSLFPPDNPGRFIVATQGKVQKGGTIIVTLTPLEDPQDEHEIRVRLKRLSFIGG